MWHPSCRRDAQDYSYKGKAALYRYPSPGSVLTPETPEDYKTPFQETHYNVRYIKPTDNQRAERKSTTSFAKEKVDPIQKYVIFDVD